MNGSISIILLVVLVEMLILVLFYYYYYQLLAKVQVPRICIRELKLLRNV